MRITLSILGLLLALPVSGVRAQSAGQLIRTMIDQTKEIEGFTAEITKEERIDGELGKQITAVKLVREPFQLYLNQRFPKEGVEILCTDKNGKALINPNAFPWFNLSLDPYGSLMRRDQHHTIYDSGFDLLAKILDRELQRIGSDTASHLFYKGIENINNRPSHAIEMLNPNYKITPYKVKEGEDILIIAESLNVSEYAILELNEDIDFYDDVSTGQEINVPLSYAKKMLLYLDVEYMLPLVFSVYDNNGLYEQYMYSKFVLNPKFKQDEFSSNNEDYDF